VRRTRKSLQLPFSSDAELLSRLIALPASKIRIHIRTLGTRGDCLLINPVLRQRLQFSADLLQQVQRHCCVDGERVRLIGVVPRSDGEGEFGEAAGSRCCGSSSTLSL
jgi:hypothetical protein